MVDKFWSELEKDFLDRGLRAMDWVEGKKDWREFYRIKSWFGIGTAYFDAVANDPEIAEALAAQPIAHSGTAATSSVGWTPIVERMANLEDRLILIQAAVVGAKSHEINFVKRPEFEIDRIRRRKSVRKLRKMQSQLLPHQEFTIPED